MNVQSFSFLSARFMNNPTREPQTAGADETTPRCALLPAIMATLVLGMLMCLAGPVLAGGDGLLLYYSFNTDNGAIVSDDSGSGNTGTVNGATWTSAGASGGAYSFNGNGNSIVAQNVSGLPTGSMARTVSFWMKVQSNVEHVLPFFYGSDLADNGFLLFRYSDLSGWAPGRRTLCLGRWGGPDYIAPSSTTLINTGTWYHAAVTYDGTVASLYINGVLESFSNRTYNTSSSALTIGREILPSTIMRGCIDEFRLYNRALASNEVSQQYQQDLAVQKKLTVTGSPSNYGTSVPCGYGTNIVTAGTIVTCSVPAVVNMSGTRATCTGWTGSGDISSGGGTSVVFTVTTDSTLTWQWSTEYYLDTAAGSHGSVDTSDGWWSAGASVTVTATAASCYHFSIWTGDVPAGQTTNNPLIATMDRPRNLAANFASNGLPEGLILYYSFNSDSGTVVSDDSGSGNTGIVNGATWTSAGVSGGAYSFNGNGNSISAQNVSGLPTGSMARTVSFWMNLQSNTEHVMPFYYGSDVADNAFVLFRYSDLSGWAPGRRTLCLGRWGGPDYIAPSSTTLITTGTWYHATVTYDGTVASLYINGVLESSSNRTYNTSASALTIGREILANNTIMRGRIDEFRLYNRALSSNEVSQQYQLDIADQRKLVIAGSPANYGTSAPLSYGTNTVILGTTLTCSVPAVVEMSGTRVICTGWSGTGDISSGSGTSVVFTVTTNSTITWQWNMEYFLDTTAGSHGSVDTSDGWWSAGASVTVTATAASCYRFSTWTGDVPTGQETNNPIVAAMDQPRNLTANFASNGLPEGLILYYSFNSDNGAVVSDDSECGNTGTVNGATWTPAGVSGGAYSFNGNGNSIVAQNVSGLPTGSMARTVSFWMNLQSNTEHVMPFYYGSDVADNAFVLFRYSDLSGWAPGRRTLCLGRWGGPDYIAPSSTTLINAGSWYHAAVTYDGTVASLYINGVLESSSNRTYNTSASALTIGREILPNTIMRGSIDEFRLYNRALSSNEVSQQYQLDIADQRKLVIAGSPANYGTSAPYGYGTNIITLGTTVTCSVPAVIETSGTRISCTGWTGSGDISSGTSTSVIFTVTTDSTLTWQWSTEYYLDTAAGSHGSVDTSDGWWSAGASVTVTATAASCYHFSIWTGDVPAWQASNNPLVTTMDRPRNLTANFASNGLPEGLILYYSFDSDNGGVVSDDSECGNTGTVNGATWTPAGVSGGAYSFNGNGNSIVAQNVSGLPTGSMSRTVSFWMNLQSNTEHVMPFYYGSDVADNAFVLFRYSDLSGWAPGRRTLCLGRWGGPDYIAPSSTTLINTGTWYHTTVTYDGTVASLYINGVLESSSNRTYNTSASALTIGREILANNTIMRGRIDEFRLYNRVLSSNEVSQQYQLDIADQRKLVIAGSPANYGTSEPLSYGANTVILGTTLTCSVPAIVEMSGTRATCTGWTGTGDVSSGSGTSVVFTVTTNSTLNWQWSVEYYLDTAAGIGGTVDTAAGWWNAGANVTITARPGNGYRFAQWSGDVSSSANPLVLTMDRSYSVTANFTNSPWLVWQLSSGPVAVWFMDTNQTRLANTNIYTGITAWQVAGFGDVDKDGIKDLFWQLPAGPAACWFMNANGTVRSVTNIYSANTTWRIRGAGDLDNDGVADLFWQLPSGPAACWLMKSNGTIKSTLSLYTANTQWLIKGVGDLDKDGVADLFWQLPSGQVACWLMKSNGTIKSTLNIYAASTPWQIKCAGDLNQDGIADLCWQLPAGQVASWILNTNGTIKYTTSLLNTATYWTVKGMGN